MQINRKKPFSSTKLNPTLPSLPYQSFQDLLIIYTAMRLLKKMITTLGLEASLEYIDNYIREMEIEYPPLTFEIEHILESVDIKKIYEEISR